MSIPYMPLYTSDYLGDTTELTTLQHGAYLLILMVMWNRGGSLPNDHEALRKIARLSKANWRKVWPDIERFFTVDGDQISQKKLGELHEVVTQKRKTLRANGKKGGRPKSLKNKDRDKPKGSDLLKQPEPEPELDLSVASSNEESTGASPPSDVSDRDYIWTVGLNYLKQQGVPEKSARPFIGKMLKDAGGGALAERLVAETITAAIASGTGDPQPYLVKTLQAAKRKRPAEATEAQKKKTRIIASDDGKVLHKYEVEGGELGRLIKSINAETGELVPG